MIDLSALPFNAHEAVSRALRIWDVEGVYDEDFAETNEDAMDDFLGALAPLGFESWGAGAYRVTFLHRDWVLKIPIRPEFEIETGLEAQRFQGIAKVAPEYLPRTVFLPEGVVIAERLDPRPDRYAEREDEIEAIAERLLIPDLREDNIGWRGDRFYFIDLGGTPG